eukprot:comp23958_c0_seq1/m.42423 comp23958_c0_seq1/g.42423  ORF comp23958_c0_seq1/g.42423 comp23958_c0_seq1/m.42423 type:complete len:162 (-) comp23958_c0_seq1:315-800(-)
MAAGSFQCGCVNARNLEEPHMRTSKYFEDVGGSFALHHGGPKLVARYSWLLELRKDLPKGAHVEAVMENPANPSSPIIVPAREVMGAAQKNRRFYFISDALESVQCKNYKVICRAYADKTKQKLLGEHENFIQSRVDTENCPTAEFMERMARLQEEWKAAS